jgi:hypothetical protein
MCTDGGVCSLSTDSCTDDFDCPAVIPMTVETDGNGNAFDELTLHVADPDSVTVSAQSATLAQTITIDKTIFSGDPPPTAIITASPIAETGAGWGQTVTFDANSSTDDVGIRCYKWTISSNDSPPLATYVKQGTAATTVSDEYIGSGAGLDGPRTLTVDLRLSDDVDAGLTFCNECEDTSGLGTCGADNVNFNASAVLQYPIVCTTITPFVNISGSSIRFVRLDAVTGEVEVPFTAAIVNNGAVIVEYEWDCGNGSGSGVLPVFNNIVNSNTCVYDTTGTQIQASITVIDDCGQAATDVVTLTVADPIP